MAVKMNLRIITKNHAADPEKGFLAKSISKSNGYATAMPTAWELIAKEQTKSQSYKNLNRTFLVYINLSVNYRKKKYFQSDT